jgi:hypothetical protein
LGPIQGFAPHHDRRYKCKVQTPPPASLGCDRPPRTLKTLPPNGPGQSTSSIWRTNDLGLAGDPRDLPYLTIRRGIRLGKNRDRRPRRPCVPARCVPRFHFCDKLFTKGYWQVHESPLRKDTTTLCRKSVWRGKRTGTNCKPAGQPYIKGGGCIWIRQLHSDAATEHRHPSARRAESQGEK